MHKPLNIHKESESVGTVALVMWLNSVQWSKSWAPLGKVLKEEGACSALSFLRLVGTGGGPVLRTVDRKLKGVQETEPCMKISYNTGLHTSGLL